MRYALAIALALAACNSDSRSAPTPTPSERSPAPPDNLACKVLLRSEAEAWVGIPLPAFDAAPTPDGWDCRYKSREPRAHVSIIFVAKGGALSYDQAVKSGILGKDPVELPGIGTRAMRSANATAVSVTANDKHAFAIIAPPPGAAATPPAVAETVAKAMASRL